MAGRFARLVGALRASRLGRHPLVPILFAALVFAVIGTALPPLATDAGTGPGLGGGSSTSRLAPSEDLAGLRTLSRWGTDIQSLEDAQNATAAASSGLNPELVKLGFIGLTLTAAGNTVVLTRPDGHAIHLTDGDALPDGRTLISVTENALTLEDATGRRETLVLFPRLSASEQATGDGLDVAL